MIGLYLCLPILKKIVESEKIAKYFLLLSFVFTFLIPWIMQLLIVLCGKRGMLINNIYMEIYGNMKLQLVSGFSGYFILGYLLKRKDLDKKPDISYIHWEYSAY